MNFRPSFFGDRPLVLLEDGELKATAFCYESGVREPDLLSHVGQHHHAAMFILNLKPADAALIAERRCFQLPVLQENQRTVAEKRRAEIHACKLHIPKYLLIS